MLNQNHTWPLWRRPPTFVRSIDVAEKTKMKKEKGSKKEMVIKVQTMTQPGSFGHFLFRPVVATDPEKGACPADARGEEAAYKTRRGGRGGRRSQAKVTGTIAWAPPSTHNALTESFPDTMAPSYPLV